MALLAIVLLPAVAFGQGTAPPPAGINRELVDSIPSEFLTPRGRDLRDQLRRETQEQAKKPPPGGGGGGAAPAAINLQSVSQESLDLVPDEFLSPEARQEKQRRMGGGGGAPGA
ncbi:MAG: hypothetical protein H7Y16_02265, partial [Candidatus Parcubacteria bacterium]|nr:hypothetical protein [Burkholderiales bacterium]